MSQDKEYSMICRYLSVSLVVAVLLAGLNACSRGDGEAFDSSIKANQPNQFARFINKMAALPSGDYNIVAATNSAGESAAFTLTVTADNGTVQTYNGSWTSSGTAADSPGNPVFPVTVYDASGIDIKLESSVDTYLYLVSANGLVFAENNDISISDANSRISLAASRIDAEAYAAAYYAAIDPDNAKDTLEKWKMLNGYYEALMLDRVIETRFRDTKDLGYGRGMRVWTKSDGSFYAFVENFQVRTIPGLEYTAINLDALILDARQHHFGTSAIEYSSYPYGAGEPSAIPSTYKFAKFYSFDATQGDQSAPDHANETRLNRVDLDGRGDKAMPGTCVYCHGGTLRPLRADGSFRDNSLDGTTGNNINGDTNARLQLLEVPSFEFWDQTPNTKAEQEIPIKQVNQAVYCTYPNLPAAVITAACAQYCIDPNDTANCGGPGISISSVFSKLTGAGEWTGDFAREMAEGWYEDPAQSGYFDRASYNENYVPLGWRANTSTNNPPVGSDQVFLEAVQPVCFACHSRRGTTLGADSALNGSQDIDFSSYAKFISHAAQIKTYVYDAGVMPLSLRGYDTFWGSNAPVLLASHLNSRLEADNQITLNSAGYIDEPGVPVVDAGPDITTTSPARSFGSNSRFVDTYSWSLVSTPVGGETATLSDSDRPRALLTASVNGDYVLRLVASYQSRSAQDTVTIKINNGLSPAPKDLNFVDHIQPVMDPNCTSCHAIASGGGISGVPVWWTAGSQPPGVTVYQEVLARVDFNDPENSLLLTKPAGGHHYGGLRPGFERDNPGNRANYDLFLNWILEGGRYSSTAMREP